MVKIMKMAGIWDIARSYYDLCSCIVLILINDIYEISEKAAHGKAVDSEQSCRKNTSLIFPIRQDIDGDVAALLALEGLLQLRKSLLP